jgi:acylphosphatase
LHLLRKKLHRARAFGFILRVSPPAANAFRRRMTVFFSGHVQGVGFRYTAKTVAAGFEITGTIRNLPDGRVELVAEGTREELDAFAPRCTMQVLLDLSATSR